MNASKTGVNSVLRLLLCFIIYLGGDEMTKRVECRVIGSEPLGGAQGQTEKLKKQSGPISNTAMHESSGEENSLAVMAHDFAGGGDLSEAGPSEACGPYHPRARNDYGMMLDVLA
jgi:hypothetical protein